MSEENMKIYNAVAEVPMTAQKTIGAGRLKGFTDINPMWRIKKLTETYGPCGVGWYYEIAEKQILDGANGEKIGTLDLNLYVKNGEEWSKPIQGTGGSSFIAKEKNGMYTSDECVDGECEVLTPQGWVKFCNFDGNTPIAQFSKKTQQIAFVKPLRFIKKESIELYNTDGVISTKNHRNIVKNQNSGEYEVFYSWQLAKKKYKSATRGGGRSATYRVVKCGFLGKPQVLTPLNKVGIMITCDGTLCRKNANGDTYWRVELSKQRKIEEAERLLALAEIDFKKTQCNTASRNTTVFTFCKNGNFKKIKDFLPLGNYPELWEELVKWDGCTSNGVSTFCTADEENASYVQTLCALSGQCVSIKARHPRCVNHSGTFILYKKKHETALRETVKLPQTTPQTMYCVEVPDTFFLIRKNREILVTGNCFKMALTDALSVACKALGFGANVYWAAGRTKYTAPEENAEREKAKNALVQELKAQNIDVNEFAKEKNITKSTKASDINALVQELKQGR